jgi:hypothetical protein
VSEHRQLFPWGALHFWRGNSAGTPATADRAVFEIGHGLNIEKITYDWPTQSGEAETLKRALASAMQTGDYMARKNIRDVLGIEHRF